MYELHFSDFAPFSVMASSIWNWSISKTSDAVKHCTINKEDQQNQIPTKYQEKESASCDSGISMNSPSTQIDSDNSFDAIKENTHEMKPVDSKIDDFKIVYYLTIR